MSWFEVPPAYIDLSAPVEGELRREPIADADVPCPRCGAREWLLIERRAEPERPFTRWRALACANCGAADGWQSGGRARTGRHSAARSPQAIAGLPEDPTVTDVVRVASFRVYAPGPSAELRNVESVDGRITGVTLAAGGLEVTTQARERLPQRVAGGLRARHRARWTLERLVDDWADVPRMPLSKPAQELHIRAAHDRAAALAREARCCERTVEIDGVPVAFLVVERDGRWAAAADLEGEAITIAGRDTPATGVSLQRVTAA